MPNQENETRISQSTERRLSLGVEPAVQLTKAQELNEKFFEVFQIERFLGRLNQEVFAGKGEIKPAYHVTYIEIPDDESGEIQDSRFKKYFSVPYEARRAGKGMKLVVARENLDLVTDNTISGLGISVWQSTNVSQRSVDMTVDGQLELKTDKYPVSPRCISSGRYFAFSLDAIPDGKDIAKTLFSNTIDVLREMEIHNFITINYDKPSDQDSNLPQI